MNDKIGITFKAQIHDLFSNKSKKTITVLKVVCKNFIFVSYIFQPVIKNKTIFTIFFFKL